MVVLPRGARPVHVLPEVLVIIVLESGGGGAIVVMMVDGGMFMLVSVDVVAVPRESDHLLHRDPG